ncbi:hypothetical protein GCM10009850_116150 [Nonomuraea monospora]|uniref:Uncharacterized protein n=1 Tax=Nonomuraea monospora TaxID=568818 RepID=A0ABP5PWM0_9ACTN
MGNLPPCSITTYAVVRDHAPRVAGDVAHITFRALVFQTPSNRIWVRNARVLVEVEDGEEVVNLVPAFQYLAPEPGSPDAVHLRVFDAGMKAKGNQRRVADRDPT